MFGHVDFFRNYFLYQVIEHTGNRPKCRVYSTIIFCLILVVKIFAQILAQKRPTAPSMTAPARAFPATCLSACNVPTLSGILRREVEAVWAHVKDLLVLLIDEKRAADDSICTYVTDDRESGDWLAARAASLASVSKKPVN